MGLLGSNFVKAMRQRGEEVNVWNRTKSRADALEAFGAKAFENAADAVKGADLIHITLKDDATVNQVLELASAGFKPGAIIIDHTTTSTRGAIDRTQYWKARGVIYLHAPVQKLQSNIKKRNRTYEQSIPDEYLFNIQETYTSYIKHHNIKTIFIDATNADFLSNEKHLQVVLDALESDLEEGQHYFTLP